MLDLRTALDALTKSLDEAQIPYARRERIDTERGALWVVSRQGLVTMKLAAGRPQDLADLAKLEGSS